MSQLSPTFLFELFRLLFKRTDLVEIGIQHLEYHYLPTEAWKKIWKGVNSYYQLNKKLSTFGSVSEQNTSDTEVQDLLVKIRETDIPDYEVVVQQFQEFLKDSLSVDCYNQFSEVYNKGDKDGAKKLLVDTGNKLVNFNLSNSVYLKKIFTGFEDRNRARILASKVQKFKRKIPFSIDELDALTYGGMDRENKDTACFIAKSGAGKTKLLRWIGVGAARRGIPVIHIQAESSEEECLLGYDATWSAVMLRDLKEGNIQSKTYDKLQKVVSDIKFSGGEIFVHAFEQFNSGSMSDVRALCQDFLKGHGEFGIVLIDYLEKLSPGDGRKYAVSEEKERREAIADKMKNLALEFDCCLATATQASDIPPDLWNNPNFVIDRHNVSHTKNLSNSFSYFISLNQTKDEYQEGIMRLYNDKLRHFKAHQTIKIYQSYNQDRFYDRGRTLSEFYQIEE